VEQNNLLEKIFIQLGEEFNRTNQEIIDSSNKENTKEDNEEIIKRFKK
tara:strand:+ start:352 stop:495 length:144 start_codon:yes stop_codon:yes gene_type:complete